jgi:hypothetical protein
MLTEQSFPPMLPGKNKNCAVIVGVEDGLLRKFVSTFSDLFAEFLKPRGFLPSGSVVLQGPLSHLGTGGLVSYSENLVRHLASLGMRVGQGAEVIPYVPAPLWGIDSPERVRDAFDLDSWIMSSGLGPGGRAPGVKGGILEGGLRGWGGAQTGASWGRPL